MKRPVMGVAFACALFLSESITGAQEPAGAGNRYDLIVRHGVIYDGSGAIPRNGDVGIRGDVIAAIGDLSRAEAIRVIDARGMAVAPGFINMLSGSVPLLYDGRSQSNLRQGVTLEVMGEGESMGPITPAMRTDLPARMGQLPFEVKWSTLGGFMTHLEERGVACNVASFVGATTVRMHVLGHANRAPTADEIKEMGALVGQAMAEGAVGVSSALEYVPGIYAQTDELIALARVASQHGGIYISHLRSQGSRFLEAIDELIAIARAADIPAEIYHFKPVGAANWGKLDAAIRKIEAARADGLRITADMYPYTAGSTWLDRALPQWALEGGQEQLGQRLKDPAFRERVKHEMNTRAAEWDSPFLAAGSAERVILSGLTSPRNAQFAGLTLAQIAAARGEEAIDTLLNLIIEEDSRLVAVYFTMAEEHVRKVMALPWVSFASDAPSMAPEGAFLQSYYQYIHPRAYGAFARVLGRSVRDEKVIALAEAIRRLSLLPAQTLHLDRRGALQEGYFADVVVFDPAKIQDHATYAQPQQYATGVAHVLVNGVPVIKDGEYTGARPGRFVRGPGWKDESRAVGAR